MGIQNKPRPKKTGKNNVTINVHIEDKTPVKVVKPEIVKPEIVKPKVIKQEVIKQAQNPLTSAPVEKLQNLATEFTRLKDVARSQGQIIPQSYSRFSDIRDKASLQTNTELLQERIRQLQKMVQQPAAPQPPPQPVDGPVSTDGQSQNMFDEVQAFTELNDAEEIRDNLLAILKDDNVSIADKLASTKNAKDDLTLMITEIKNGNEPNGNLIVAIEAIKDNLILDTKITDLEKLLKQERKLSKVEDYVKTIKTNRIEAEAVKNDSDKLKPIFQKMEIAFNKIDDIFRKMTAGFYKDRVKERSTEMREILEYFNQILNSPPQASPPETEEPSESESDKLMNIRISMADVTSTADDINNKIAKLNISSLSRFDKTKFKEMVTHKFSSDLKTLTLTKLQVERYINVLKKLGGNSTNTDILANLNETGVPTISGQPASEYFVKTIYDMIAFPGTIVLDGQGEYDGAIQNKVEARLEQLGIFETELGDFRSDNVPEFRRAGDRYIIIKDSVSSEIEKIKMLKNESNIDLINQTLEESFTIMDIGSLASSIAFLTESQSMVLNKNDELQLNVSPTNEGEYILTIIRPGGNTTVDKTFNSFGNLYKEDEDEQDDFEENFEDDEEEESSDENPNSNRDTLSLNIDRRTELKQQIAGLYETGRSNSQVGAIYNQVDTELNNANTPGYVESETILDTTDGNIPLAIASLHALRNIENVVGKNVYFEQQSMAGLPGGAKPLYHLFVDGVKSVEGNGTEQLKFNQYGDIYTNDDISGSPINLRYPFRV